MDQTMGMMGGSTMTQATYEVGAVALIILLEDGTRIEAKNSESSAPIGAVG